MFRIAHDTSFVMALVLTAWLKVLHLFSLLKWHPTGFLKTTTDVAFFRYIILFILLYAVMMGFFVICTNLPNKWSFLTSLIFGLLLSYGLISLFEGQWVQDRKTFAQSIPFIVTVLTVVRFIIETASYHHVATKRKRKIPYEETV